jgi:peptidoglycan hydrolase CwlO-like protein
MPLPSYDWFKKNQPKIKELKTLIEQRREQIGKLEEEIDAMQKEINRLHTYDPTNL